MNRLRLINIGLLLSFCICYMEWGYNMSSFVIQAEYDVLFRSNDLLTALTHPLIAGGFIGQILLIVAVIQRKPRKVLNTVGVIFLSAIAALVLLAGILSLNIRMILSALPFAVLLVLYIRTRKQISKAGIS